MKTFDLRKNEETRYRNIQIRGTRAVDDKVNMIVYLWKSDDFMDTCIRIDKPDHSEFNVKDNIIVQSNFHPTTRAKIWQIDSMYGGSCIVLYTTLNKHSAKVWLDHRMNNVKK